MIFCKISPLQCWNGQVIQCHSPRCTSPKLCGVFRWHWLGIALFSPGQSWNAIGQGFRMKLTVLGKSQTSAVTPCHWYKAFSAPAALERTVLEGSSMRERGQDCSQRKYAVPNHNSCGFYQLSVALRAVRLSAAAPDPGGCASRSILLPCLLPAGLLWRHRAYKRNLFAIRLETGTR